MNDTDNRATLKEIDPDAHSYELVEEDEGRTYLLVHPDKESAEEHREARMEEPGIKVLFSSDEVTPFHHHIGRFCTCELRINGNQFRYQGRLLGVGDGQLTFESRDGNRKLCRADDVVELSSEEYRP